MATPQILIVGAGPTGLILALWLTKTGIPVRIIDKTDRPGTTSRALVLHARNLEFYRQLGIDRITVEQGIEAKAVNLWLRGRTVGRLPFGELGVTISPYPYALIYPQDCHEEMLTAQLKSLGIEVERGSELIALTCTANQVGTEIQKQNGDRSIQSFTYLAACDGASSTVREKLGIAFEGGTYDDTYYVADIVAGGPVINGDLNIALDEADFLAIFPMKGEGRSRLVGALRQIVSDQDKLRWEDINPRIFRDLKIEVKEVKWLSHYRVHHRVAARFKLRHVFLLGDAAHIHSPVGGQGMNTGIGDAVNLAWKLAAVIKDRSPATILESYEPERMAFARRLVSSTDRVFAFVSARGPIATWVRLHVVPRLLPFLFQFATVRRMMFRLVSQIGVKYPHSPLSAGSAGAVHGGERLPWVPFKDAAGRDGDNFSSLSSLNWQVHCYGDPAPSLQKMCQDRNLEFHIFPWNAAAKNAGLQKNAAYIIRPDGQVGLASAPGNPAQIAEYLDQWILKSRH